MFCKIIRDAKSEWQQVYNNIWQQYWRGMGMGMTGLGNRKIRRWSPGMPSWVFFKRRSSPRCETKPSQSSHVVTNDWPSLGLLRAETTPGPMVMLGTKRPSITSTCTQSAPACRTSPTSWPSLAKSAERIDGLTLLAGLAGLGWESVWYSLVQWLVNGDVSRCVHQNSHKTMI